MKNFMAVAVILSVSFTFSGCNSTSLYETLWGKEKPTATNSLIDNKEAVSGVFIWKPDASAAVTLSVYEKDSKGNFIPFERSKPILESETIGIFSESKSHGIYKQNVKRTYREETEKEIAYLYQQKACVMSSAAIKLRNSDSGISLDVPASLTGTITEVELRAAAKEFQKVTALTSKNEATTFLDVALFNICMASINGLIAPEEVAGLINNAVEKAATFAIEVETTKQQTLDLNKKTTAIIVKLEKPKQKSLKGNSKNLISQAPKTPKTL